MHKLLNFQRSLFKIAKTNIQFADAVHIGNYSVKRMDFLPGSYVLIQWNTGPPTRLHTVLKGPMRVILGTKNTYLVQDLVKK
jgi:hypothetical protein